VRIRFVSPWYPDYAQVHAGIFVAKQVEALRASGDLVTVDVPQIFPAPPGPIPERVITSMRGLAARSRSAMFANTRDVTYVPTPVPARGGALGRTRAMASALSLLDEFREESPELIHAHLGVPTAAAIRQIEPELPLVVTEHQSTLATVFAEPEAARAYADVVRTADAFICVSEHLREQIVEGIGEWAREQIEVVPNIVDLSEIPLVHRPVPRFTSWVYVGGLMAHKGVQTLLKAFDEYVRAHDAGARLTLVGDGPLRQWIEDFAAGRGLADAVRLAGSVSHDRLGDYLGAADVMVHLSPAETFGIAPLEAIGSGLPVVSLRNKGAVNTWGDIESDCGVLLALDTTAADTASAIADLRTSPGRLRPEAGRQAVLERYSPEVIAQRLHQIYEPVIR